MTRQPPFDPLGLRCHGIPEVGAGLGIRIGRGADKDIAVHAPQGLLNFWIVAGAEQQRADRQQVHGVDQCGAGAAIAGDRLQHHRHADMVLPHAAVLLRHVQGEQVLGSERLHALARKDAVAIALDGVRRDCRLAEFDQPGLNLLLLIGQIPLRIKVVGTVRNRARRPTFSSRWVPPVRGEARCDSDAAF